MNFYGCVPRIVSGRVTTFGLWRRPTSPSGNQSFRQRLRVFHQLIGPFAKVQSYGTSIKAIFAVINIT